MKSSIDICPATASRDLARGPAAGRQILKADTQYMSLRKKWQG